MSSQEADRNPDGAVPPAPGSADPAGTAPEATGPDGGDPALESLELLRAQVSASIEDLRRVLDRAEAVRTQRLQGRSYTEITSTASRPLTVELISGTMQRLATAGGRWRRDEARALHREGLTMDRIAELFGVTRQRVSALLKPSA